MVKRKTLLLTTFGGRVSEVVIGLRSLPHDRLVVITVKGEVAREEHQRLLSLLDRFKVQYQVLEVDKLDITGSAVLIEEMVRRYKGKEWQVLIDIIGGSKLLSDASVMAAVATGSEVCCFEGEARRIPLLEGLGIKELLFKEVAEALSAHAWPIPLAQVKDIARQGTGDRIFMKMKELDLVSLRSVDETSQLCLTDRGQACLDWLRRLDGHLNVSSE
jgi:hypothetical protein